MRCAERLRHVVEDATPHLLALAVQSARRPAEGKWSAREIIGHLIDSAINNHQRFVRAQFDDDLVFQGYAQQEWVIAGRYQEAAWEELIRLWRSLNLQLARVMEGASDVTLQRPRPRHNLDQIAFVPPPPGQPATLEYLMCDYVVHLAHHLAQIFRSV